MNKNKNNKIDQQSRFGWGGKRTGAGAPLGNFNAVKHGERSRRRYISDEIPSYEAIESLTIHEAKVLGMWIRQSGLRLDDDNPATWREWVLLGALSNAHGKRLERALIKSSSNKIKALLVEWHTSIARLKHEKARL